MEFLLDPSNIVMVLTLSTLEIVLGIDNLVVLAMLLEPLPAKQKKPARKFAVGLALVTRIMLLFSIAWVISLTKPLFTLDILADHASEISAKDLFFIVGGIFLLYKSYSGLMELLGKSEELHITPKKINFWAIIIQAAIIDIIFSLDSVITAVGITEHIGLIVIAMCLTVIVMLFFVGVISDLIEKFPSLKILAITFIALIGIMLISGALGFEIPKSYIYSMMAFGAITEFLNIITTRKINSKK
jgi:predicted tellurium resistance membrane protein TerC